MSLLIWLPFNNKIKNNGLSKASITSLPTVTPSYIAGPVNNALSFNGSTYWKSDNITLGTEATIACWSKTSANGKMTWVLESDASAILNLFESSYYTLNTGDSNNNPFKTDSNATIAVLHDNAWHHFAVTFGNSAAKLYIDGTYRGTAITFRSPKTTNKPIKIGGGFSNGHSYDWNGGIADFRVYDHALRPDDVLRLYQNKSLYEIPFTGDIEKPEQPIWLKLLHHNAPASNLFTTANYKKNTSDNLYSRCGWMFNNTIFKLDNGNYEFFAKDQMATGGTQNTYRWTQTSSPTASTITGFKKITNSCNSSYLVGLKNGGNYSAFHNGGSWWCACGSYTAYQGGTPGFQGVVTTGYIDLWVRAEIKHLPNDYEELQWVKFAPGQYINTELIIPAGNTCLTKARLRYETGGSGRDLMGWEASSAGYWGVTSAATWEHVNSYTNSNITVLNDITMSYNSSREGTYYQIGALSGSWSVRSKYIYNFKIYVNGDLKRNMIPCMRKSDSKVGMYDLVTKKFYTHTGSGNLVAGPKRYMPKEYEKLEYIEGTGTQYINTNFNPSNNTRVVTELMPTTNDNAMGFFGAYPNNDFTTNSYGLYYSSSSGLAYSNFKSDSSFNRSKIEYGKKHFVDKNKNLLYIDNELVLTHTSATFQSTIPLHIFKLNFNSNPRYAKLRVYDFKIYENDDLVRHFIPAKRKSDNVIGMYDMVSGQFFTNAGTGSFTGA